MSRSIDRQYSAGSPPRNVTPLHYSRRGRYGYGADYYGRPSAPLVYQIHGPPPSTSSSDAALPFSPIRQAYYHPPHPPLETDLYSCFSPPPRRVESRPRTTPHAILSPARSSIFRSKQSSVLVDRDPSQDTSSVTYDSKDSSPPLQRPAEVTSSSNKEPAASALKARQVTPRASESFPCKLHAILSNENYSDYISWLPHGRAFRVLKPKAFEEDVLPKYFRSTKFASFMRQVSR